MVTSEARLIVSDAILQGGREAPRAASRWPAGQESWTSKGLDWIRAMFLPETRNYSPFDRRVAMLRNKVEVMKDTRSYLIALSFTATFSRRGSAGRQRHRAPIRQGQETATEDGMRWPRPRVNLRGNSRTTAKSIRRSCRLADEVDSARAALKAATSTAGRRS